MDSLGSIGTALATPKMIVGIFFGIVIIIIGFALLAKGETSGMKLTGGGTVLFGCLLIFFAWFNRKLTRSSKGYAAYMGARDLFSIFR